MKWIFKLMLPALVLASCSEESGAPLEPNPDSTIVKEESVSHEMISLGSRLENPYSVRNVSKALASLYPTRADAQVPTSALYVRFLPKDGEQYDRLTGLGVELVDHPLDYAITTEGDYYHDPSLPEEDITWQYGVVPPDFVFPDDMTFELIESCFIPEEGVVTRGFEDVDWDAVERRSFELTGNESMLVSEVRSKAKPSGRIMIKDDKLGKAVGVSGVKMIANVFVKVSTTYTDSEGRYAFSAKFSAKPRYSICFKNKLGFSIGFNLILVPASVSSLGKDNPEGIDVTIDQSSDNSLFRRCAVNNAAYDYYQKCHALGITPPASNIRFWILGFMKPSSTLMMHHGAVIDSKLVSNYLDVYKILVRLFAPDITIGSRDKNGKYSELYSAATHEMAHATHFAKVGSAYWNKLVAYVLSSYLMTGSCYGTGNGDNAGYCEVSEIWAYYIENMFYKDRYGSNPEHGTNYWFHPEILWTLEDGGVSRSEICSAMKSGVTDLDALRTELSTICPAKKTLITQTFKRYSR